MGISIYNISEQVRGRVGESRAEYQELIQACKNCYAQIAFKTWANNKLEGTSELPGSFLYTFKGLTPILDTDTDQYYLVLPSSYVEIPHEMGVNLISYMKGQDKPFVRFASGFVGLFAGLQSNVMGGNQCFEINGNRMYFPKMKTTDVGDILMKLSVAFSDDVDEELNISPSIAAEIVDMVVARFSTVKEVRPDTLIK